MIRRRLVFHLAGYDPIGAGWHWLFKRELGRFARTWNVRTAVSDLLPESDRAHGHWTVKTDAPNWSVETIYQPMFWDDIVLADFARPVSQRLVRSPQAFFDIVASGAAWRYFKANWQYGLFFLFPHVVLCAFAAVALLLADWGAHRLALTGAIHVVATIALGVAGFFVLLRWPGRRWRVQQGLDDWIFSWDYVHGRRPDVDARIDRFADELMARARDPRLDEIVVVGHSMGATLAVETIARALTRDPDLGCHGPTVCLLTVGSTIPKFSLHPAGERFRAATALIAAAPAIAWADYNARADAIGFYKFDPVTLSRFYGDRIDTKPVLRRVKLHDMLKPRTYWRFRFRFMRLHYQFVMANELRATYDYFMMVCGPIPFTKAVTAASGPAGLIAPDGGLIDPDAPAPAPVMQPGEPRRVGQAR